MFSSSFPEKNSLTDNSDKVVGESSKTKNHIPKLRLSLSDDLGSEYEIQRLSNAWSNKSEELRIISTTSQKTIASLNAKLKTYENGFAALTKALKIGACVATFAGLGFLLFRSGQQKDASLAQMIQTTSKVYKP